jgi:hypothetical protein
VSAYDYKLEEVTAERVGTYEKLLNGVSSFTGGPTHTKPERAKVLMTGLRKAVVFRATEVLKAPPGISAAAARDELVTAERDCEGPFQSGGAIYPCALAVAASKYAGSSPHINLDMLLESAAATRRAPGRPRKTGFGNCYGSGSSSPPSSSSSSSSLSSSSNPSAKYFETNPRDKGGCFYHKWRVVASFDWEVCVGNILSYRDDYHEEQKPHTSKTPFTRLWKWVFEGDDEGDYEEHDAKDLSVHISRAQREGYPGPGSYDKPRNQLQAAPNDAGGGSMRGGDGDTDDGS